MIRLLLVIDDYNEMIYLQTILKKLGLDIEAVSNPRKFTDTILGFNPSIVVMTAHGKKVTGFEFAQSMRKKKGLPDLILFKTM